MRMLNKTNILRVHIALLILIGLAFSDISKAENSKLEYGEFVELIKVTECNAVQILESESLDYAELQAIEVPSKPHLKKFYKPFTESFDIRSQKVTKYSDSDTGFRIYETAPIVEFEPYIGSLDQVNKELRKGSRKYAFPGYTEYGYHYYWETGAFVKNHRTNEYFVRPSKFKVYLSFGITLPEWRHDKSQISPKELAFWNKYICSLYKHERKHVEITRKNILEGIDETLNLKARSTDELEGLVRSTWDLRKSEIRADQTYFDKRTRHGAKPDNYK